MSDSEYARWAKRNQTVTRGKAVGKPHISLCATAPGFQYWLCKGGRGMFDGVGSTPAAAYECWKNQGIPF